MTQQHEEKIVATDMCGLSLVRVGDKVHYLNMSPGIYLKLAGDVGDDYEGPLTDEQVSAFFTLFDLVPVD